MPRIQTKTTGERVRSAMVRRFLSPEALSKKARISQEMLMDILADRCADDEKLARNILRLSKVLRFSPKWLTVPPLFAERIEDVLLDPALLDRFTGATHNEKFLRWSRQVLTTIRDESLKLRERQERITKAG